MLLNKGFLGPKRVYLWPGISKNKKHFVKRWTKVAWNHALNKIQIWLFLLNGSVKELPGRPLKMSFFIIYFFSELFSNTYTEKRRERERERELNQISLTRASMPHQRFLFYYFSAICLLISNKDFMEDINPFRRILLFEHLILYILYFICRVIRFMTVSFFSQEPI